MSNRPDLPPLVRLSHACQIAQTWANAVQSDRDRDISIARRNDMLLKHLDELEEAIRDVRGML